MTFFVSFIVIVIVIEYVLCSIPFPFISSFFKRRIETDPHDFFQPTALLIIVAITIIVNIYFFLLLFLLLRLLLLQYRCPESGKDLYLTEFFFLKEA